MVLFKVNLLYFRLRIICYAHALPDDTPKDTLHCIEHFACTVAVIKLLQHTNVLGLVIASSIFASLQLALRRAGTEMRYRCALPNQFRCQTSKPYLVRRALRRCRKPAAVVFTDRAACSLIGVGLIQKSSNFGGDQETANELLVELNGIEPLTSCLQSTRSPN